MNDDTNKSPETDASVETPEIITASMGAPVTSKSPAETSPEAEADPVISDRAIAGDIMPPEDPLAKLLGGEGVDIGALLGAGTGLAGLGSLADMLGHAPRGEDEEWPDSFEAFMKWSSDRAGIDVREFTKKEADEMPRCKSKLARIGIWLSSSATAFTHYPDYARAMAAEPGDEEAYARLRKNPKTNEMREPWVAMLAMLEFTVGDTEAVEKLYDDMKTRPVIDPIAFADKLKEVFDISEDTLRGLSIADFEYEEAWEDGTREPFPLICRALGNLHCILRHNRRDVESDLGKLPGWLLYSKMMVPNSGEIAGVLLPLGCLAEMDYIDAASRKELYDSLRNDVNEVLPLLAKAFVPELPG